MSYSVFKSIKKRFISVCLIISLAAAAALPGCAEAGKFDRDSNFRQFTKELFRNEISSNTISLHYSLKDPKKYGISEPPVSLGSFTTDKDKVIASAENLEFVLKSFPYRDLSGENRLTYDILKYSIEKNKNRAPFLLYEEPLSTVGGVHTQLPVILAEFPFRCEEDIKVYLKLLQSVPDYFAGLEEFEKEKAKRGLFMPDFAVLRVISQCIDFMETAESNYLYSTFADRLAGLGLTSAEKDRYIEGNAQMMHNYVFPAYSHLTAALRDLRGSGGNEEGVCRLPDGKKFYEFTAASVTGSGLAIEEMKELACNQIREDLNSIKKVTKDLGKVKGNTEGLKRKPPELILEELKAKIRRAFPEAPESRVTVKYVPEGLQPHLSPAFYILPPIDCASENVIFVNRRYMDKPMALFTTLAHEGYPGHLYQFTYYAGTGPDPVRSIFHFGGYLEGWATYAEMCGYYLADIPKDQAVLLQKNNSLLLGVYALADIGIHYDGWSRQKAAAHFARYGIRDKETVDHIYDLILGSPANYLMYYIGYLEMLKLKKEWITRHGENKPQKEFHRAVLNVGPAPFEIVREYIETLK